MQTVVVKGRMFSVEDTLGNEIERMCGQLGTEIKLVKDTPRPRTDDDHPPRKK